MILESIAKCLDVVPLGASRSDYADAIVTQNILGKSTEATRKESFRRLRELYSLDPATPLFSIYRQLDQFDPLSRPLLSLLMACARDPLLRATVPVILSAREGDVVEVGRFDEALSKTFSGHFKPKIQAATARHIASTWKQSGHLGGKMTKIRSRVGARPAALTMALIMASLQGEHGESLLSCSWCRLLDLNASMARSLAAQAHREGLLDFRAVGSVVEITFPRFALILEVL